MTSGIHRFYGLAQAGQLRIYERAPTGRQRRAEAIMTATAQMLQVRVARKLPLTRDIALFELVSTDDHALPALSAGSHIAVQLRDSITRQYSFATIRQKRIATRLLFLRTSAIGGIAPDARTGA